jgi:uncharacterized membrane protein (UPF0136 family)
MGVSFVMNGVKKLSETVKPALGKNGLGVASLVLGIVAIAGCLIPFLNIGSIVIAIVGLVLGVVALLLKNRKKGLAIAGTIVSLASLIIAITVTATAASVVSTSIKEGTIKAGETLTYEVTSDAPVAGNITYSTFTSSGSGMSQNSDAPLPFKKDVPLVEGNLYATTIFSLTAMASADATTITCKVSRAGTVLATNTSTGSMAMVSCSGSAK